jgi:N,N'-diacetyllegionaminate synthase
MANQGEMHEVIPWFMRGLPGMEFHTIVVAEIGNNHEGSLGNAIHMIECAALAGAEAVKIQVHVPAYECTGDEEFPARFQYHPQDDSRKHYWYRMSFNGEDLEEIQKVCDRFQLKLIASCFCGAAVSRVIKHCPNIWAIKIASGETDNRHLIEMIHDVGIRTILSTGMSETREVNTNVCLLLAKPAVEELYVLQCTTMYPTPVTQVGVNVAEVYSRNLLFKGGLSDHSGTIFPSIIAAYLGALMVEVHVCFHKRQFGADISSSITFEELAQLVKGVAWANELRCNPINKDLYQPEPDAMVYRQGRIR